MEVELTDNNRANRSEGVLDRKAIAPLFSIAYKTIDALCRENNNLLIFPDAIKKTKDQIQKECIFNVESTENIDEVRITTGNMMGFIGVGDLKIKIKSRFDSGRNDYFLHYMLQRVISFNLLDLNHNNEQEDVFDFLMFMFPALLRSALQQGLYREYQTFKYNDSKIKGTIDINRHVAKNIPFMGKVAYSTREYAQDNDITELIRHTIEFMKTKKYGQSILNIDSETKDNVKTIIRATPLYSRNARHSVINSNIKTKIHPYYTSYVALQTLCMQILRMEEVRYGKDEKELSGILFDGAWLWEEYVYTIIKDLNFQHAENKLCKGEISIFDDNTGKRYPDFYIENDIVLDAKYKRLEKYNEVRKVNRDDIHQIVTYIVAVNAKRGGFIVPLQNEQSSVPTSHLKHLGTPISIFGLEISKTSTSYEEFCKEMKVMEKRFVDSLMREWNRGS